MLRPCSAAVGPVLSTILVVPACYGLSMAVGSSNYIEIGQSSNWLRTDRGTSLNVGVSTRGRSRCHGSGAAVGRGTCNRAIKKPGDYAHSIRTDNTNRFVFVPHLGTDQVFQFLFDEKSGWLSANTPPVLQLKQGTGRWGSDPSRRIGPSPMLRSMFRMR